MFEKNGGYNLREEIKLEVKVSNLYKVFLELI